MRNYMDSDYTLNKYSEGIVYRFSDGVLEITLADFLAENPGKTEADFRRLKEASDADYLSQDRADTAHGKRERPLSAAALRCAKSPEDIYIGGIDARIEEEGRLARLALAKHILDKLTEVQRRRYLLYAVCGLNERQIAEKEGATQQAVSKSLYWVRRKIKKFLGGTKNRL